ncbi:MAG: tetratricopeptide repeat protein, partial [Chitinophagales bacterium]|nr:tetratricopeptide repeat protein [Chitinophagales bacterium]
SSGSIDIPHVQIHDHFIRIPEEEEMKSIKAFPTADQFKRLACITSDNPGVKMKAKAYLSYYEKFSYGNQSLLDSVKNYLDAADDHETELKIHYLYLKEDFEALAKIGNERPPSEWYNDPWSYYRIGEAFNKEANYEKALIYLTLALENKSEELDFLNKQAVVLIKLMKLEEAKAVLYRIINLQPKYASAYANLGYINIENAEFDRAEYNLERAIKLEPDYKLARWNLIKLMSLKGEKLKARKYLDSYLNLFPEDAEAITLKNSI